MAEGGDGRGHRHHHQNHREAAAEAEEEKRRPAAGDYYGGADEEESEEEEQALQATTVLVLPVRARAWRRSRCSCQAQSRGHLRGVALGPPALLACCKHLF